MKIGVWSKPDKWLAEVGYDLGQADILEAHRFIYLFFDQNAIDNHELHQTVKGELIYGKAIQINLSISKGGKENITLVPWMRNNENSTHMVATMYCYDTVFETDITNIYSAKFILNEAMISGIMNDYNINKAMLCGENFYEKDFRNNRSKKEALNRFISVNSPDIPDPMYYTIKHQETCEDDLFNLNSLNTLIEHEGKDLYDDNTRISVMNMTLIDTLEPKMRKKIYDIRHQVQMSDFKINNYDQTQLSEECLYNDFQSMQHGYTYIYDSQAGINVISEEKLPNGKIKRTGYMPFKKYQFDDKLQHDIEETIRNIKDHARDVEKQFGSVRIHFTPLYFGDKTDIFFKDWKADNQPILKDKVDIDNSFKLSNEISTLSVDAMNNDVGLGCSEDEYDDDSGWDFN